MNEIICNNFPHVGAKVSKLDLATNKWFIDGTITSECSHGDYLFEYINLEGKKVTGSIEIDSPHYIERLDGKSIL